MTRILGIDPGSQRTGVGIIDVDAAYASPTCTTSHWCCWALTTSRSA